MIENKKYWLENYGCQMNRAEASAIEIELQAQGWIAAENDFEADLAILNTCTVRKTAENRIWGRIGHFKHLKKTKKMKLAVIGCMAENWKEQLKKDAPTVDIVAGTKGQKLLIKELTGQYTEQEDFLEENRYSFHTSHGSHNSVSSLIPIMHGCDNFCSYCIVPYVRGREVSRDIGEIIEEIEKLDKEGIKEITLLGQNVNSYFDEVNSVNFAQLLEKICRVSSIPRIRFLSSHPKDLSDEVIDLMAREKQICDHLHLPVQHGSSKILKEMNRRYTREDYLRLIGKLKKKIPHISVTTDIMVGFPGETEEDLDQLMSLLKEVKYTEAFTYFYNAREGTKAFNRDDSLSEEVKKSRLAKIISLQRDLSAQIFESRIGSIVEVLVESVSKKSQCDLFGRTERNESVLFKGNENLIGKIRSVKIHSKRGQTFLGEEVVCPGE